MRSVRRILAPRHSARQGERAAALRALGAPPARALARLDLPRRMP